MQKKARKNWVKPISTGLKDGGAEGIRTHDPHNAIVVLYQLSYDPTPTWRKSNYCRRKVKANY